MKQILHIKIPYNIMQLNIIKKADTRISHCRRSAGDYKKMKIAFMKYVNSMYILCKLVERN